MQFTDKTILLRSRIIGDIVHKIMPRPNSGYDEVDQLSFNFIFISSQSYNGNQIKTIISEAQNIVQILDHDYPTTRMLDEEILIFFELLAAYNWLSSSVLGKILRHDYLDCIDNFRTKAQKFLEKSYMVSHIHR